MWCEKLTKGGPLPPAYYIRYFLPRHIQTIMSSSSASQYVKLSQREHILKRPDSYVGTTNTHQENRWIWDAVTKRMVWKSVSVNPALLKIFDEILVNALDHRVRLAEKKAAHPMKQLDVTITPTTIVVRNDGSGIPVAEHPEHKCYAPELIFGHLLTSSNYNDTEERIVGGLNGYGAKLTNIFSTRFTVETVDTEQQKKYRQVWTDNMVKCEKPSITKFTGKPYTEISFCPDLKQFKWPEDLVPSEIPSDMLQLITTRVIDAAACAGKECKVTLNGQVVATNTFPKYIELYVDPDAHTANDSMSVISDEAASVAASSESGGSKRIKRIAFDSAGARWEIGAILTRDLHGDAPPDERHISFVNGIATRRGGKHVEYVSKLVLTAFCDAVKKRAKVKLADLTPTLMKDSVVWFINSTIVNPNFDTQTKETLMTPATKFGSLPVLPPKFVDKLIKIGLLDEAQHLMDAKTSRDAKKMDGKKKSVVRGIPKLEDAQLAGTGKSSECTLILTEGDSAATTAISGLKVVGREKYGVFPLKGKILNVKDATVAKKNANQELTYIKQILGLEHGKVYTDLKQLRYGRVMIMTDQDVDGSHIKGLLMNLFHTEWPSLLQLNFLCCLMTPLLKVTKGSQTLCFYSESEYEAWKSVRSDSEMRGWKTKYYKGLGTSTAAEAREYFSQMNMVDFVWDTGSDSSLDLAFNKKRSDDRKQWLTTYERSRNLNVKAGGDKVAYTRFVNDELIHFSIADNARSIPSVMDGLKPSQRKILWSALKRNLTTEIRVAQLAGYVSETAAYHHGEASLTGAIIGMAQNFVGSNNLNLLSPNGQFGSRLMGGEDSASPRYIHTALEPIVKSLIRKEDDAILKYMDDDGLLVEPEFYIPVIPMLLVNGALGIGTGFSTNIIPYNPRDIVAAIRGRLHSQLETLESVTLTPWWAGFRGQVIGGTDGKTWVTKGIYEFVNDDSATIRIRELPIGCWTKDYKAFLDQLIADQEEARTTWITECKKCEKEKMPVPEKPTVWLKSYEEAYNDVDVDFILYMDSDAYHESRAYPRDFEAKFKLTTQFKTTNMVAFNTQGVIHKYPTIGHMLEEFYHTRRAAYERRKAHELARLKDEITELNARHKFVKGVVEKRLIVANADDDALLAGLQSLDLPPLSAPESRDLRGYEYLLRMRVDRLKASAVAELERDLVNARERYERMDATSVEALWLDDLATFEASWSEFEERKKAAYNEAAAAAPEIKTVKKRTKKAAT
jgi:DNA topoisomerase II